MINASGFPTPFAKPRRGLQVEDCLFYHTMDIPQHGTIEGLGGASWDLRHSFDDMLGMAKLAGNRILEIGPASGFLTFEMERRGASVVAVEVPEDHVFDIVPWLNAKEHWQTYQKKWLTEIYQCMVVCA